MKNHQDNAANSRRPFRLGAVGTLGLVVVLSVGISAGVSTFLPANAPIVCQLGALADGSAGIPLQINHQGVVTVNNVLFNGDGDFYFALVDPDGNEDAGSNLWTNDGSQLETPNRPDCPVSLPVVNGIYSVRLGNTDLPCMTPIPTTVFDDDNVVLRIWFDDGDPEHGTHRLEPDHVLTSAPYAYRAAHAKTADSCSATSIPFYIQGLELEYAGDHIIRVTPGAVDIDGRMLKAVNYSPFIDVSQDVNYITGHNSPNPWIYVYVYNDNNSIAYILADVAPDKADHEGHEDGTKRYYIQDNVAYRCIGAVRTDDGTKTGTLLNFFQRGNVIMWDVPISITTTPSAGAWSNPLSCSGAIPAISEMAVFGLHVDSGVHAFIWIRPNGSTWNTSYANSIMLTVDAGSANRIGGQRWCMTDSARQIQYWNYSTSISIDISVEGYILNIR